MMNSRVLNLSLVVAVFSKPCLTISVPGPDKFCTLLKMAAVRRDVVVTVASPKVSTYP